MNANFFKQTCLCVAVRAICATAFCLVLPATGWAKEYQFGDFDLTINSTLSIGTSMRLDAQDPALYATGNRNSDGQAGRGFSNTGDDGNLNFGKGDTFSSTIKGVHDFDLKRENYGFFTRVKWFYDYTLNKEGVFHGHNPNNYAANRRLNDNGFHPYARFDGIDVLDAFAYVSTTLADKPLDVRLGRQVVSWGESTLILSPISGLNTTDVSAFRRPGADLKEGFTPSEMLYANFGLTDNTSLEAFYQLKWRKTVPEGCGTYFATADFSSDGCNRVAVAPAVPDATNVLGNFFVPRLLDRTPDDGGQFGFAFRSYVTPLDTEFGLYAMNYHSRLPLVSVQKDSLGRTFSPVPANFNGAYLIDYPEDLTVLGASFATNVGEWAWSGEASMTKDAPIQINATDLLRSGLSSGTDPRAPARLNARLAATPNGAYARGYDVFDVTQVQSTLVKTFDGLLGANALSLVGEVAAVLVSDLPNTSNANGMRYGRNAVFGGVGDAGNRTNAGYVTDFSWGYRLRTSATYRDVVGGIDLVPSLIWSHDVEGWSPEPGQVFNEGRQSIGLGLGFEFDANTRAFINYTTFANSADYDALRDRDFLTFSASYSF